MMAALLAAPVLPTFAPLKSIVNWGFVFCVCVYFGRGDGCDVGFEIQDADVQLYHAHLGDAVHDIF